MGSSNYSQRLADDKDEIRRIKEYWNDADGLHFDPISGDLSTRQTQGDPNFVHALHEDLGHAAREFSLAIQRRLSL